MNSNRIFRALPLSRIPARCAVLLVALLPLRSLAVSGVWEINLVGDMYPDGRDMAHPTPDKPVFYYPVVNGFAEMGAKVTGTPEQPPPAKDMIHHLATTLAAQGYLASREVEVPAQPNPSARPGEKPPAKAKALQPAPSLILVFNWGSLRPEKLLVGDDFSSNAPPQVINQDKMIGLLAGRKFDSTVDFGVNTEKVLEGVQDDRYFVMVSAYDFNAYNKEHKKVLLWVAKMSLPSAGVTMAEAMPALIKSGGDLFGRETIGPKVLEVPNAPEGKVEVGTPTVVEPKK